MAKIRKSIFRNGIVMLSLLAAIVLSSSVAYAQVCQARADSGDPDVVRAEGLEEAVKAILLACKTADASDFFGAAPIPTETKITIELNTTLANGFKDMLSDSRIVDGLTYTGGDPSLGSAVDFEGSATEDEKEVLSDDKTMISWEITSSELSFKATAEVMIIGGIRVNASAVGDGGMITAVVRVNGEAVHEGTLNLSDVTTGLDITVSAASGLQCAVPKDSDGYTAVATITFVEGFNSAIAMTSTDVETDMPQMLVLNFRDIPDGVTVMVSEEGTGKRMKADGSDLAPLTLNEDEDAHDAGKVLLSVAGAGSVVYTFDEEDPQTMLTSPVPDDYTGTALEGTDDDLAKEWNNIEVTFTWEAGEVPLSSGNVTVSYHPASGDNARFIHGPTMDAIEINECVTSLVFPFVTNMHGFDTGIALTNTSGADGSCTVDYSGTADNDMIDVMAESTKTFGLSAMEPGFQGYIEMTCNFRNGKGFVFISNGFESMGGPTAAQGYLVADELQDSD